MVQFSWKKVPSVGFVHSNATRDARGCFNAIMSFIRNWIPYVLVSFLPPMQAYVEDTNHEVGRNPLWFSDPRSVSFKKRFDAHWETFV